ncbi:MAG: hypothetical protein AAB921_03865, partial [Patescibacteria group bacterium]
MGDVLDIKRIMYALSSNQDHVSEFLHFSDPNHQIDVHARKLLMLIAADDERDRLSVDQESGYAGHASLQELGFRVGASVRETVVLGHLANIGAKRASLAFALDLWASKKGTEPVGLIYTDPIPDQQGNLHYLVVREV